MADDFLAYLQERKENQATAYKQMAQDEEREAEALEWAEASVGDVGDEGRYWPRLSQRGRGDAQR